MTYTYEISDINQEGFQTTSNGPLPMDDIFSRIGHETKFWKPSKGKTYAYWLDDQDKINSVESSSLDQQPDRDEPEISNPIMNWVLCDLKFF